MWVKICGNTNVADALAASEAGADAVGFVFAPGKRQIDPARAAAIVERLPDALEKVGVFPDWTAARIVDAVTQARLTAVQLHGGFDLNLARAVHAQLKGQILIMQVVHWDVNADDAQAESIGMWMNELAATPEIDRILIDTKAGTATGGTGLVFPWEKARALFAEHPNVILAGGLRLDNVGEAVHLLKPWGVDVASGVEAFPGKKDLMKIKRFVQAARKVERAQTESYR